MASIIHMFHIAQPQAKVLEALSSLEGLQQWWTNLTTGNAKAGGEIEFRFFPGAFIHVQVLEVEDGWVKWKCIDAHPEWIGTEISFLLTIENGKTKVSFCHDGWEAQTPYFAHCNFSWGRYLESLRNYCELGKGSPFRS